MVTSATTFPQSTAYATSNTYTYTETVTVSWSEGGYLNPGHDVNAVAEMGPGQGTFRYTSLVTVALKKWFDFTYVEDGEM